MEMNAQLLDGVMALSTAHGGPTGAGTEGNITGTRVADEAATTVIQGLWRHQVFQEAVYQVWN